MTIVGLLMLTVLTAQKSGKYTAIYPGVPWLDDRSQTISAHGACIIKENNRFYLFGEIHSDTSNAFAGFSCYSSTDLMNWKYESVALPVQATGGLSADRVGERPKVMKCPSTGEYIMYMHADSLGYKNQSVGYATSSSITGPYTFRGSLLFNGKPIRKWDIGTFQDNDGTGYILIHGGEIYQLSLDYKLVIEQVSKAFVAGGESPAMFRKDSLYYWLGSQLTSWERNDNYYFTATYIRGPWTNRGLIAPEGTLTWNAQTSYVLPVAGTQDTTYLFMGDRWSFPKQNSAATYVWLPLTVKAGTISLPVFQESWKLDIRKGTAAAVPIKDKYFDKPESYKSYYTGQWQLQDSSLISSSDKMGASVSRQVKGKQIYLYGEKLPDGGYARLQILDRKGRAVANVVLDFYCKYPVKGLVYASPVFKKGRYTMELTVMGEHGNWSDKKKNIYGSTGNKVTMSNIIIN